MFNIVKEHNNILVTKLYWSSCFNHFQHDPTSENTKYKSQVKNETACWNHQPCRQIISIGHLRHPSSASSLKEIEQNNKWEMTLPQSPQNWTKSPQFPSRTKVEHSSASPDPAAACRPGLLCDSSKLCRIPQSNRAEQHNSNSPQFTTR